MNPKPSEAAPSTSTVLTFVLMALICMGIVIGACVRLAQALEPNVGDIAVFKPGQSVDDVPPIDVTAWDGGRACVLSSSVIAQDGGSLVIIARRAAAADAYVVHWAGPRTSTGANDCGSSADLTVGKTGLLSLAGIAGGFGIHPGEANG